MRPGGSQGQRMVPQEPFASPPAGHPSGRVIHLAGGPESEVHLEGLALDRPARGWELGGVKQELVWRRGGWCDPGGEQRANRDTGRRAHGGSGAPPGGGITLGLKDFKGQGSGQREGGVLLAEGAAQARARGPVPAWGTLKPACA